MPITHINNAAMPSLTEWLEKIGAAHTQAFREEDNTKRDRLEVLYQTIGLLYDRPERLTARDIADETPRFRDIVARKGDELCALRLVPADPSLPKLRNRGKTLKENLVWFREQQIDPDKYKVEIVPHADDTPYAATFLLTDRGILGEIVAGKHWTLTQGMFDEPPIVFSRTGDAWQFSAPHPAGETLAKRAAARLRVEDAAARQTLAEKLQSLFTALSHAAIVSRELGKPCLVGVADALEALKTGDRIMVDADAGKIALLYKG